MISPNEFKERWDSSLYALIPYDAKDIDMLSLPEEAKAFLIEAGLPKSAAPYLSFMPSVKGGGLKLNKKFNLSNNKLSQYVFLGSTSAGDPVCIKEENGEIVYLDHEDNYKEYFINSSVCQLAEYLLIYSEFINLIEERNGEDAYLDNNAPDDLYFELVDKFKSVDAEALNDRCFWQEELDNYKK